MVPPCTPAISLRVHALRLLCPAAMFVQRLNELTGEAEWVVTSEGEGEEAVADALGVRSALSALRADWQSVLGRLDEPRA